MFLYSNMYMKSTQPCNDNKAENQRVYLDWYSSRVQKWATKMLWEATVIHFRFIFLLFVSIFAFSFLQFETWTLNIIIIILKWIRVVFLLTKNGCFPIFHRIHEKKKSYFLWMIIVRMYEEGKKRFLYHPPGHLLLSFIHQISTQCTTRMRWATLYSLEWRRKNHITKVGHRQK